MRKNSKYNCTNRQTKTKASVSKQEYLHIFLLGNGLVSCIYLLLSQFFVIFFLLHYIVVIYDLFHIIIFFHVFSLLRLFLLKYLDQLYDQWHVIYLVKWAKQNNKQQTENKVCIQHNEKPKCKNVETVQIQERRRQLRDRNSTKQVHNPNNISKRYYMLILYLSTRL